MLDKIENISVSLTFGSNDFSMNRGSFKYGIKYGKEHKLALKNINNASNHQTLIFESPLKKYKCNLVKESTNDLVHIYSTDEYIPNNRWIIRIPRDKNEHFYGCGETYSKFDLNGEKIRIWVAEHQNAKRISTKIIRNTLLGNNPNRVLSFDKYESYYVQPTFVSSNKYFIHINTNAYSEFDFSNENEIVLKLQSPPDIYIGTANSFPELSTKLSVLLGKQKPLPNWIYDGGILAVQQGPEIIDEKITEAQKHGVQINGIWSQDWCGCRKTGFGYQVMWNWEFDKELYHDLPDKIKEWNNKGIHFLGYINPFLALEKDLYKEASEKGYCVKNTNGEDYLVTITTFPAAMVDFTNPDAYEWYKNIIKENMIGIGMSGWMADFGEYLPPDSVLYSGENAEIVHNTWPELWAKINQEAISECGVEDKVFFFTRSGHTDTIKYSAMMWTGDQHVDWSKDDGLPSVIPATLSLAMSGYCITHSDVGGYTTILNMTRSKDLLLRWMELCTFSPLFRTHEGNQPSRNSQFYDDNELLNQLSRCTKIHKSIGWYLKDLEKQAVKFGLPMIRPLFYHYSEDNLWNEKTEYLLGEDILFAPIIEKNSYSRTCILPNDEWIHAFSGKEYIGGTYNIEAPLGQPPVFVRKNSINCEKIINSINI